VCDKAAKSHDSIPTSAGTASKERAQWPRRVRASVGFPKPGVWLRSMIELSNGTSLPRTAADLPDDGVNDDLPTHSGGSSKPGSGRSAGSDNVRPPSALNSRCWPPMATPAALDYLAEPGRFNRRPTTHPAPERRSLTNRRSSGPAVATQPLRALKSDRINEPLHFLSHIAFDGLAGVI
jgi:hypothetical protein